MRRKLVVGNWKMHGSLASNAALLDRLKGPLASAPSAGYAVCVPYPYLAQVSDLLTGSSISWGAQDVSEHDAGAYTGEVSAPMLKEFGCRYAIVGHSERRALYGDSDAVVAKKFAAALRHGLTPILCVGETLAEREGGRTEAVLERQLNAVLDATGAAAMAQAVLAYEPVWAIGTGKTATPDQAQSAHAFARGLVAKRDAAVAADLTMLYGRSVKAANAGELFAGADVDGGLIGGASLVAEEFVAICRAAARG
jgi:triosephosphate isomerase